MNRIMETWQASKGWKTLAVSLAVAIVGVLQSADWTDIVPADKVGPVMVGIGVLMAALRIATDGPVGRK